MPGELAAAFVRLELDDGRALKSQTQAAVEEGAQAGSASPRVKAAGEKAGGTFSSGFQSQVSKGLPSAGEKAGQSWGEKFGSAAGKAVNIGAKLGVVALAGIGIASVKMSQDFQAAMTRIQTQAGGSSRDVKILSADILGLGGKVQQSPIELANAMFHLKSVGLDNVAAMHALVAASHLAAVGNADLEDTTNAVAGAWRSGIKGAQNFGEAAATLNAIVGAGNVKMQDLVNAIGTGILPSARTFGVSLKSVGAALALMTDEGIPAQVAATRLRMSLSLLGAPSEKAAGDLKTIGINSIDLANAMRSPGGITAAIGLLKQHLDASGLSLSEQAQLLSHAFGGGRSSSAILTLLNNYDVLQRKQDQINASMGRFGQATRTQAQTASAQWGFFRSTLDTVAVEIGAKLLPVVTGLLRGLLQSHTLLPLLAGGLALVTAALVTQIAAWVALNVASAGIIAAIGLAVTGLILLFTHWKTVTSWVQAHWPLVIGIVAAIMPPLAAIIVAVKLITDHWRGLASAGSAAWRAVSGAAVAAWHFIDRIFHAIAASGPWHVLSAAAKIAFDIVAAVAKIAWDVVSGVALLAWAIIRPILRNIGSNAAAAWGVASSAARTAWNIISGLVRVFWNNVGHPIFNAVRTVAGTVWGAVANLAQAAWSLIGKGIRFLWNVISAIFGAIIHAAASAFGWVPGLGGKLRDAAHHFDQFRDQVNNALAGLNNRHISVKAEFSTAGVGPFAGKPRASGGPVYGAGTTTSDSIPAWLSNREWVIQAASATQYGDAAMASVNAGTAAIIPNALAAGGPASGVNVQPVLPSRQTIERLSLAALQRLADSQASALLGSIGGTGAVGDTGARSGSAALAQAFARSILPPGWSWPALVSLWNQESGWNAYAVNPSSGAYGIPQSLGHGHPYNLGDYKAQIIWGLNYIRSAYGSSQAAWAHEVANNWYAEGGPVRRPRSLFDGGGWIREPVMGIGASGRQYAFAQNGVPEYVGRSGPQGPLIGTVIVQDRADLELLSQRLSALVPKAGF